MKLRWPGADEALAIVLVVGKEGDVPRQPLRPLLVPRSNMDDRESGATRRIEQRRGPLQDSPPFDLDSIPQTTNRSSGVEDVILHMEKDDCTIV